jgi:hypothetical protein
MKRFLSFLTTCFLACSFAWAVPNQGSQASLIFVKATHPPVHHHKAHKAGKHHAPKRPHHHSI